MRRVVIGLVSSAAALTFVAGTAAVGLSDQRGAVVATNCGWC